MTRETKIGLLVGLAFIIVIGILLSDHINSSTDPVRAEMTDTYKSVERSVESPDARPSGTTTVIVPRPVIPQNPVPTHNPSPVAANSGSTIINIGPGADPSRMRVAPQPPAQTDAQLQRPQDEATAPPPPQPDSPVADSSAGQSSNPAPRGVSDGLRQAAREHGEEVVPLDGGPVGIHPDSTNSSADAGNTTPASPAGNSGFRQVKAQEGDTVSRLAAKYLGANTLANREAIIRANPSMTSDGHLVMAGRTYQIPVKGGSASPPQQPTAPKSAAPQQPSAASSSFTYYTVKDNDNLWRIAAEQLGSGARWTEIRDLNQDVLKGSEQLQVNMRLKLPKKAN